MDSETQTALREKLSAIIDQSARLVCQADVEWHTDNRQHVNDLAREALALLPSEPAAACAHRWVSYSRETPPFWRCSTCGAITETKPEPAAGQAQEPREGVCRCGHAESRHTAGFGCWWQRPNGTCDCHAFDRWQPVPAQDGQKEPQ
jgi:hypothetical protein